MKRKVLWAMLMAFVMMFTLAIAASAQDRDDQNRDRDDQNRQVMHDRDHDRDRAGRDQWQARNNYEYRTYDRDQRPDGWARGNTTNRRYCENHEPCYTYQYQGQPYYYYNDNNNGRMWVRRNHRDRDDMNKDRDDRNRDRDDHHDNDQHR